MNYHPAMTTFDRLMQVLNELRWKPADFYNRANIPKQNFTGWKNRGNIPAAKIALTCDTIGVRADWLVKGTIDPTDKALGVRLLQSLSGRYATPESASIHSGVPYHHLRNAISGRYQLSADEYDALSKLLGKPIDYLQHIHASNDNTPEYILEGSLHNLPENIRNKVHPDAILRESDRAPEGAAAPTEPGYAILEFRQLLNAYTKDVEPGITSEIFNAAMSEYLREPSHQATFANYMAEKLQKTLGTSLPAEKLRQIISETIEERNALAHSGMDKVSERMEAAGVKLPQHEQRQLASSAEAKQPQGDKDDQQSNHAQG